MPVLLVAKIESLEDLNLKQNPITAEGLAQLESLKNLKKLNLANTGVGAGRSRNCKKRCPSARLRSNAVYCIATESRKQKTSGPVA